MHREILGLVPGDKRQGDHISRECLDNQKSNLRIATKSENGANLKTNHGSSKYKGVSWDKSRGKWRATIKKYKKQIHIGYFDSGVEAARAYDEAAVEIFGAFARPNLLDRSREHAIYRK